MFTPLDKAIAAFLTPVFLGLLGAVGVRADMTVETAISLLISAGITAVMVYFIPNK